MCGPCCTECAGYFVGERRWPSAKLTPREMPPSTRPRLSQLLGGHVRPAVSWPASMPCSGGSPRNIRNRRPGRESAASQRAAGDPQSIRGRFQGRRAGRAPSSRWSSMRLCPPTGSFIATCCSITRTVALPAVLRRPRLRSRASQGPWARASASCRGRSRELNDFIGHRPVAAARIAEDRAV